MYVKGNIMDLQIKIILVVMFFIILISIQYTLNKILMALREIRIILLTKKEKQE
jgi:hypothetical protein